MKNLVLALIATLLTITTIQAQTQLPTSLRQQLNALLKSKTPDIQNVITHSLPNKIQPRSTQESRLIATTHHNYNGTNYVAVDSNEYAYTGSNGGDFNSEFLKYTTENEYAYRIGKYTDDTLSRQTFDANDNIDSVINQLWHGSYWQNLTESYLGYDANNNDTLELDYQWAGSKWDTIDKVISYYTGTTQDSEIYDGYDGTTHTFEKEELVTFTANASDTSFAIQLWDPADSSWENFIQIIEYYNDTSELVQMGDTTAWVNYERVTTSSISNGTQTIYIYSWTKNAWDSTEKEIGYYDSNSNDTAVLVQEFDAGEWLTENKYSYQYNGFNQVTYVGLFNYVYPNYIPVDEDNYYYETYEGIAQLPVNNNHLSIYPNPSSGEINIISKKTIDNLKVTNLLGQLVYESQPEQQRFTFELNQPGLYFMTVREDNTITTSKITVSR